MSHSVHPYSFRLNILRTWKSRWFANPKKFKEYLKIDIKIREWLIKKIEKMYIEDIKIERLNSIFHIIISTARPGLLIGRKGEGTEKLKKEIKEKIKSINPNDNSEIKITIEEVREPESFASIIAHQIKEELEKRQRFRRVIKKSIEKAMASRKVQGVKVGLSGRLDGSEMGRKEWLKQGKIPLQTLRADIDFAKAKANLPYGDIGIKVWIYRGEIFEK